MHVSVCVYRKKCISAADSSDLAKVFLSIPVGTASVERASLK